MKGIRGYRCPCHRAGLIFPKENSIAVSPLRKEEMQKVPGKPDEASPAQAPVLGQGGFAWRPEEKYGK